MIRLLVKVELVPTAAWAFLQRRGHTNGIKLGTFLRRLARVLIPTQTGDLFQAVSGSLAKGIFL